MVTKHTQRGMTFWSLLFVLAVIATVVFLTLKLFPAYLGDFKVKAALDSLARQPDVASMGKAEIINGLDKRFDIDDIKHVDLKKDLSIEQRGRNRVIRIQYEAVIPLVYNVSVLLEFDHSREVAGSGQQ